MKLLFGLLLSIAGASAQGQGFENYLYEYDILAVRTLANLNIDAQNSRRSVRVRNCASDISHIKLRVRNAGIQVTGGGVTYTDGSSNQYNFTYTFAAGYDSPWMSLDSFREDGKCVKTVFVNARSLDNEVLANVQVLGNTN